MSNNENELILDRMKKRARELNKQSQSGKFDGCIGMTKEMFEEMVAEAKACGREKEIKYARISGNGPAEAPMILGVPFIYPGWQMKWMTEKKEAVIKACKARIKKGGPASGDAEAVSLYREIIKTLKNQAEMLDEKQFELSEKQRELNDMFVTCAQLRHKIAERREENEEAGKDPGDPDV